MVGLIYLAVSAKSLGHELDPVTRASSSCSLSCCLQASPHNSKFPHVLDTRPVIMEPYISVRSILGAYSVIARHLSLLSLRVPIYRDEAI